MIPRTRGQRVEAHIEPSVAPRNPTKRTSVKVAYVNVFGSGIETSGPFWNGPVLSLAGAKTVLSWARVRVVDD